MKHLSGYSTALAIAVALPFATSAQAQFQQLWRVGEVNDSQAEFSQEDAVVTPAPGNPVGQDDDFYFAGTYPDPIGVVGADEPFANFDRALLPNDTNNRIHFDLSADDANPLFTYRLTTDMGQLGRSGEGDLFFDVTGTVNGVSVFEEVGITTDFLMESTFLGSDVGITDAGGPAVVEISLVNSSDSSWIQFDHVTMEVDPTPVPEPAHYTLALGLLALLAAFRRRRP